MNDKVKSFCIITHVEHGQENNCFFGYGPYVKEINIWTKHAEKVIIVAPLKDKIKGSIDEFYNHQHIEYINIPSFDVKSITAILKTIVLIPKIAFSIFRAMKNSEHIHLRCPGNIGLIGSLVQIVFPKKKKTAKYAGNWDLKSKQPFSYKIQKWILSNTFLTKNIQVLVYGEWENSTKNIKPFFTASYYERDKIQVPKKTLNNIVKFIFVGTLSNGKNPLYAIQIVENLLKRGKNVQLNIYGDGLENELLQNYIKEKNLEKSIHLYGNQNQDIIKQAYIENHFIILPSQSEGWPKAIAEGMFWSCFPIATDVSCLRNMLDNEKRGLILKMNIQQDVDNIESIMENENLYQDKVNESIIWSRKYTLNIFEMEIEKLMQK